MGKREVLHKIKASIKKEAPDAKVYLFGSRARGDNKPNSDWDILILVENEKVTNEIDDKFRQYLYDIELDIGQIISLLIYPKQYWKKYLKYSPLYENILNEGVLL